MARGCPFDAVLLIAFGGPQGRNDVRPFLANVLRGRRVTEERIEEVVHHYDLFGGVSPLTTLTHRQAAGLRDRLATGPCPLPVFVGMRNWHPFLDETITEMGAAGIRRAIGFVMAPHRSYSSCAQYRQNVGDARKAARAAGGASVDVAYVGDWFAHPLFIEANARQVRGAIEHLSAPLQRQARIVFTAHSLPEAMPGARLYSAQVAESARLTAERCETSNWAVAYQSRSGRPEDPWLGPDITEYIRAHRGEVEALVISPIGFVADHIEVLYDLDREAMTACEAAGLPVARAATVNDDPVFLDMMADVVRVTVSQYASGRPLTIVG